MIPALLGALLLVGVGLVGVAAVVLWVRAVTGWLLPDDDSEAPR